MDGDGQSSNAQTGLVNRRHRYHKVSKAAEIVRSAKSRLERFMTSGECAKALSLQLQVAALEDALDPILSNIYKQLCTSSALRCPGGFRFNPEQTLQVLKGCHPLQSSTRACKSASL